MILIIAIEAEMKLTTRTRYGTRLMIALALNFDKGSVFLKDISKSQDISEKYLSQIVIPLRGAGLISSLRGAHGGYRLSKAPSEISLKDIMDVLEGDSSLVDCIKNPSGCARAPTCVSHDIWSMVDEKIAETLSSITLDALVKMSHEKEDRAVMYYL